MTKTTETKQRILEAALEAFAEKGYAGATTRAIAAQAGVNEVTLFRQFGNKQNLLMAVVDQYSAMSDLGAALEGQLTGDYQEDLLRIGTLFLEMMNRHRRAVLMTICEAQHSSEVREVIARPPLQQRKMLGHYLQEQMERGVVRDLPDPKLAAQAFFAMLFEYSISQSLYADPSASSLLPEEVVAQVIDIFVRGTVKED